MKLFTISFLLLTISVAAQDIGEFPIEHFKASDGESFRSHVVFEDKFGNIFSGTDDGIKVFKGGIWEDYYTSDNAIKQIIRDEKDQLIIGSDKFFGSLSVDSLGNFALEKLSENLTDETQYEQLYKILPYNDGTFFHVDNRIIKVKDDRITDYNFEDVLYAGTFNKNIVIQRLNEGLFIYAGNDFRKINGSENYANVEVDAIVDLHDGTFILLFEEQAILYNGDNFSRQRFSDLRNLSFDAAVKNDKGIFLSTLDKGIFQFSLSGDLIRNIAFDSWCNNLYSDSRQNIWISSNNGVSLFKAASGFELITFNEEKGRAVAVSNENIILGTSRGTYSLSMSAFLQNGLANRYRVINQESVNSFNILDGDLMVASKNGEPYGNNTNQLFYLEEAEILLKADKAGLSFYERPYRQWVYANHLYGLEEEVKKIIQDKSGSLWVHAARNGVVRLDFDPVLNTIAPVIYNLENIRTDHINGIFLINGRPIVTTVSGIFEYNQEADQFQQSQQYEDLFGEKSNVMYLHQDAAEDIWYIGESECGMINIVDKGVQKSAEKIRIPELSAYVNVEQPGIFSITAEDIIFNGKDGFIYVNKSSVKEVDRFIVRLHRIANENQQSNNFLPRIDLDSVYQFTREHRDVELSFSSTNDIYKDQILYSYDINDKGWSPWQEDNFVKASLSGGSNSVKVRARTGMNNISNTFVVPIMVTQEWYYEEWAKFLVIALAAMLLVLLIFYIRRLFRNRNRRINTLLQENRDQKRDIRELIEKNEVLSAQLISAIGDSDIQTQLKRLSDENENPEVKKAVKKLTKRLKAERTNPTDFIIADPDFTSKLKVMYPTLTKKDIRLCSLLKMDLTTKEIAPMLEISVRGVEISRYRLRKKLDLNNEIVLADFLKKI